ncbi:nucleotidyl transferase AbiEii/AbiGii toxin family protein [Dysgonomonas sp. GY75]|uniref:nucleotidyl transferase AbiEii/AbiGii toxin family protein n=1 Tax=Dysgonomonas sp. GY75 TaxID=2780419 RepID=UPI0018846390|nr:nucleotidyl transferase AbiEii/AbiGii toxin family protein [Dysgonomonas sp. GY75]MBF0650801.1 nucleotidyl transferase AbiEii/AbiGii toxin family protein [Dysgonomonas sp. GY75]
MKGTYKKQVSLLLDILPEVAKEDVFALHGGTAINLFCLNMPRLSVDIDLTYIPASESRDTDLQNIRLALEKVKEHLRKQIPNISFSDPIRAEEELKLICTTPEAMVKIEVNQINRGIIAETELTILCDKAQEIFDKFCEVRTVSQKQLWGGKIIAALDRQHPRDLFDIRNMINEIGYSMEIKEGFIFFLLCSKRPMQELLNPHRIDQSAVFESQFKGMTDNSFGVHEFENTRELLIKMINESLTNEDKEFLLTFSKGEPDWTKIDYSKFPAIRWKLLNIQKLKDNNPSKYAEQVDAVRQILF